MHPQIRQPGPGNCPICGMTLEPVEVTAQAPPNHELADMTRRFWIGLVLALPVFILEMGSHVPALGLDRLVPMQASIWIQFALSRACCTIGFGNVVMTCCGALRC